MSKFVRTIGLLAVIAMLVGMGTSGVAQEKKAPKKAAKPAEAGGYVEIKENKAGKFYFSIRTADGKYLAGSLPTGVAKKEDVQKMLDDIKAALATGKIVEAKTEEPKEAKKDEAKDK